MQQFIPSLNDCKIGIIGLGYVGLPLAIEFGKKHDVLGFDIDKKRVDELNNGEDKTNEANLKHMNLALQGTTDGSLFFTNNIQHLSTRNIFIITVPTPVNIDKSPDLSFLYAASEMVGNLIKKGAVVIYESTVYPGCTEEYCVPILEKFSGLKFNEDFYCGYSPERINPGDKVLSLIHI